MRSRVPALLISLVVLVLAACNGGSNGGSDRFCQEPDGPGWCFCFDDDGRQAPDEVSTCDADSVKVANSTGLCCESNSGGLCDCQAVGCYQQFPGYCGCGMSQVYGDEGAQPVGACFKANSSDHCCKSTVLGACVCSVLECNSNEVEVSLCGGSDVTVCSSTETRVASCK